MRLNSLITARYPLAARRNARVSVLRSPFAVLASTGAALALATITAIAAPQAAPGGPGDAPPGLLPGIKIGGSSNIHVVGHVTLGGYSAVDDDEIEQDPTRPYAYVSIGDVLRPGFAIIDLRDLDNVRLLYRWQIENAGLHKTILGALDGKYFKLNGRYYYVQSLQFNQGTPDADLGAVVADVTGLPDTSKIKIVARIREPDHPGGFHNSFIYRHSDGHIYLLVTIVGAYAQVYDLAKVIAGGDQAQWKVGEIPVPSSPDNARLGSSATTTSTWPTTRPRTRTSFTAPVAAGTTSTTSPT